MDVFRINIIISVVLVIPVSSAPSWKVAPQDTAVHLGSNVTLPCQINNLDGKNVVWHKHGNTPELLFFNHISHQSTPRYSVVGNEANGEFNLRITQAGPEDDATYRCSVGHSSLSQDARLTVIVSPGQPSVRVSTPGQLVAGQVVTLTCTSQGGNPAPTIRWYKDGRSVTSGQQTAPPSVKFGITQGTLRFKVTRNDHNAVFSCSVENAGNRGNPLTASKSLQVQYGPEVWFKPPGPLRVVKQENIHVSCVVDANPQVTSVQWFKGTTRLPGSNFTTYIRNVDLSDTDTLYTCIANNGIAEGKSSTQLQVIYSPQVQINHTEQGRVLLTEGSTAEVVCDVVAEPRADSVIWRKVGSAGTLRGNKLQLSNVDRNQAGRYVCEARNTLIPTAQPARTGFGNASVDIVVHYPPGGASVEQSPKGHVVIGQEVTFRCSVSDAGNPPARFTWRRSGDDSWRFEGAELRWSSVTLQDSGVYECIPSNKVATGQTTRRLLTLNEKVTFLPPELERVKYTKISDRDVSVMCEVRGKPAPQVTWYKNGEAIGRFSDMFTLTVTQQTVNAQSYIVTSQLQWKGTKRAPFQDSLQVADTGNYTCLASNSLSSEEARTVQVLVQYPPVVSVSSNKVGVDINQTLSLECHSHALPRPVFVWYHNGVKLHNNDRLTIQASHSPRKEFPHHSQLKIQNVTRRHLGVYRCEAVNDVASKSAETRVVVKDVPDAPSNLTVHQVTWQSALLEWRAGFDGGYRQRFVVKFVSKKHQQSHLLVRPEPSTVFNVTGLYPSTQYVFWVFGENQLGEGAYSTSVTVVTPGYRINVASAATYDQNSQVLTFSASSQFCVKITISHDNKKWQVYEPCAPSSGGSVKLSTSLPVNHAKVSLCLRGRQDICSLPVDVRIVKLGTAGSNTVAIIGGLCGAILVILILIIVAVLCRRQRTKKNPVLEEKVLSNELVVVDKRKTENPRNSFKSSNKKNPKLSSSYTDQKNMQQTHYDIQTQNLSQNKLEGALHNKHVAPSITDNSHRHHTTSQHAPGMYRHTAPPGCNKHNLSNSSDNSREFRDASADSHSSGSAESGYSTPTKTKKVIHEIIV